jgi:dTMP kinase
MTGDATSRGRFITFEGGEGAGKTVQTRRLARRLEDLGVKVVLTREPGGSPLAETLRKVILSGDAARLGAEGEALLFSAARIDHVDATIAPALARGDWVVCDRFADSTRVYQGAAGRLEEAFISRLEDIAVGSTRPDLTLILDLPPKLGLARAARRRGAQGADRFEAEGLPFHRALRAAFLEIARREPSRCAVIDASGTEAVVAEAIWTVVSDRLKDHLPVRATTP